MNIQPEHFSGCRDAFESSMICSATLEKYGQDNVVCFMHLCFITWVYTSGLHSEEEDFSFPPSK